MTDVPASAQRIDKWLWHARFARTRTTAQKLVQAGHVRINRDKINAASRVVRPGDVLTMVIAQRVRVVAVLGIADRREAASKASLLYEDRSPVIERVDGRSKGEQMTRSKRPDKRDRRRIVAMKRISTEDL